MVTCMYCRMLVSGTDINRDGMIGICGSCCCVPFHEKERLAKM